MEDKEASRVREWNTGQHTEVGGCGGLDRFGYSRKRAEGAGEGRPRRTTSPSSHLVTPGDDHVGCYLWWVGWVGDVLAGKVA